MPNFVHELTTARPGAMEEPGRGWWSLSLYFPQTLLPKGNGKLRLLLRISFQLVELEEDKVAGSLGKQSMCRVYNQPWRTGSCERHMDGTGRCRGDGTLRLLLPVTPRNKLSPSDQRSIIHLITEMQREKVPACCGVRAIRRFLKAAALEHGRSWAAGNVWHGDKLHYT